MMIGSCCYQEKKKKKGWGEWAGCGGVWDVGGRRSLQRGYYRGHDRSFSVRDCIYALGKTHIRSTP